VCTFACACMYIQDFLTFAWMSQLGCLSLDVSQQEQLGCANFLDLYDTSSFKRGLWLILKV